MPKKKKRDEIHKHICFVKNIIIARRVRLYGDDEDITTTTTTTTTTRRRTKDDDEWRERGGAMSLSRARSVSRVRTKRVRELRRTRSLDEMQSVSRGVFLFGEVSENVLAVS